jgi:hypothetical protein
MANKLKGIELLRNKGGRAIGSKRHVSFTHEEIEEILREVDKLKPRSHRTVPVYDKAKAKVD